eukprot:scaffold6712_cov142-Cylindrotheca_fusiformis.AAC.6
MIDDDSRKYYGRSAVFDRLYSKQTAASIGHRMKKEEEEAKRRKEEEEEYAKCTFKPTTKWDIALERRRKAQEQTERASPSKALSRSDAPRSPKQEVELANCTFKPRTKWSLASERRRLARKQREKEEYEARRLPRRQKRLSDREIRDRKREEEELKYCTFRPTLIWRKNDVRDADDETTGNEMTARKGTFDRSAPRTLRMDGTILIATKVVSQNERPVLEHETINGKGNIEPGTSFKVDHHTLIAINKKSTETTTQSNDERLDSRIESKSSSGSTVPEWKRKYDNERKQHEVVVSAQGHAPSETMHVRGASIISQSPVKRTIHGVWSKSLAVEAGAEKVEPTKNETGDSSNAHTLPAPHRRDPFAATGSKSISHVGGFRVASAKQKEAAGSADAGECRVIPQGGSNPQAKEVSKLDNSGFRVAQNLDLQCAETSSTAKKPSKWKDRLRDKRNRSDARPQEADKSSCTADEMLVEGAGSGLKDKQENAAEEEAEHATKEERERLARLEGGRAAKEEGEKLAQLEAERAVKEEREKLAQEEAERAAKEVRERLAQEEAERAAKEERERLAQEEAERAAKEEQEKLAQEEAECAAKEEQVKLAQPEAERAAKEEREKLAQPMAERAAEEEREKLAQIEAERAAEEELAQPMAERAAEEELAEEEAKRAAKDERERLAQEEAERAAKEERVKLAQEEAERAAMEEREKLAQLDAERAAIEEREKLAQLETERAAMEEREKLAQEEDEDGTKEEQMKLGEEIEHAAKEEQEKRVEEAAKDEKKVEEERVFHEEAGRVAREKDEMLVPEEGDRATKEMDLINLGKADPVVEDGRDLDTTAAGHLIAEPTNEEPKAKRKLKGKSERAKKWKGIVSQLRPIKMNAM